MATTRDIRRKTSMVTAVLILTLATACGSAASGATTNPAKSSFDRVTAVCTDVQGSSESRGNCLAP
jgi:hypothetical protein